MSASIRLSRDDGKRMPLSLSSEIGEQLQMATLKSATAALLASDDAITVHYTDSDGDAVTVASDADVKELVDYMVEEGLERVTVLVARVGSASKNAAPKHLLSIVKATKDMDAKKSMPKDLLAALQGEEVTKVAEDLCACDEFMHLVDVVETARVVSRCPAFKPLLVQGVKQCITSLVRLGNERAAVDRLKLPKASSGSGEEDQMVDFRDIPVHCGIMCDGCQQVPILGVRCQSLEEPNFDVCGDCEAGGKWVSREPFIKIKDSSRAPTSKCTSGIAVHRRVKCDGCGMGPIVGIRYKSTVVRDIDFCEACKASGRWTKMFAPFIEIRRPVDCTR
uniref:ZZ-type domain-containing protein n=2 Tax=Peronospora matthiolae TaxID=2874970 RepID=A0AAV1V5A1_9STRA